MPSQPSPKRDDQTISHSPRRLNINIDDACTACDQRAVDVVHSPDLNGKASLSVYHDPAPLHTLAMGIVPILHTFECPLCRLEIR